MKMSLKSVVFLMCISLQQAVSSAKISLKPFEKYRLTNEQRKIVRMIIVQLVKKGIGKDCADLIAHEYGQSALDERKAREGSKRARTQHKQYDAMGLRMYYGLSSHTYN